MSNKVRLMQAVLIIRFDSEDLGYTGTMSSIHKADIKRLYREYATFSNDVIDDSVMHTISRHETLVEIPSNHINKIDMTTGIYKSTAVVRQRQVQRSDSVTHLSHSSQPVLSPLDLSSSFGCRVPSVRICNT